MFELKATIRKDNKTVRILHQCREESNSMRFSTPYEHLLLRRSCDMPKLPRYLST